MVFGLGVVIAVSMPVAAGVLSMVFPWRARRLQGVWGGGFERPCLSGVLLCGAVNISDQFAGVLGAAD